ncbi:MAG: GNAT family N-acetyltransferase [Bacillaceae bacterium]|nr:GNAT family N-acetyltransferase [Bacillaceae bacterium]
MVNESGIIKLRKTKIEDLDFVCHLESLKENSQFIIPWTKEKHKQALENEDILHLMIEEKITNKAAGYIILAGLKNENKSIELVRITIHEKGRGYGKESFKLIKEWVFDHIKANRLWLDVKTNNIRAINLYKQQGFRLEGTLRECLKSDEGYESLHVMSLLKKEYDKLFKCS